MKNVSKRLWIILLVLASFVLLQACASAPKLPEPKPGLYVNEEYRFSVEYPEDWIADTLQSDQEVLRVHYPNQWKIPVLTVNVAELSDDAEMTSAGFIEGAKANNPGAKRFKVLSEEMITLNDGTPALALTWKWSWTDGVTKLQTGSVMAYREKNSISTSVTTVLGGDTTPEVLLSIAKTLKLY
jgi:hypothetical protein